MTCITLCVFNSHFICWYINLSMFWILAIQSFSRFYDLLDRFKNQFHHTFLIDVHFHPDISKSNDRKYFVSRVVNRGQSGHYCTAVVQIMSAHKCECRGFHYYSSSCPWLEQPTIAAAMTEFGQNPSSIQSDAEVPQIGEHFIHLVKSGSPVTCLTLNLPPFLPVPVQN